MNVALDVEREEPNCPDELDTSPCWMEFGARLVRDMAPRRQHDARDVPTISTSSGIV